MTGTSTLYIPYTSPEHVLAALAERARRQSGTCELILVRMAAVGGGPGRPALYSEFRALRASLQRRGYGRVQIVIYRDGRRPSPELAPAA